MELTLKNYTTVLSKELLKLAAKNMVRECDELEKGCFIGYVDDGADSFDVSITLLKNGQIESACCDCKTTAPFCRHKAALLLMIDGEKKVAKTVKVKSKISKVDALLEDSSLLELKDWVKGLILKNPDIELAFVHHFSAKNHFYTKEEIEKITSDALKAVVKNKKNIDPTQLKKTIDLWTEIHEPVVKQYQHGMADATQFLNFHALLLCCLEINQKLNSSSKKIPGYVAGLLKDAVETTVNIYDEDNWRKSVVYFVNYIFTNEFEIGRFYLTHLQNIISVISDERKTWLINEILKKYENISRVGSRLAINFTQIIFEMVDQFGMFEKYFMLFTPQQWNNEYNKKLISNLIKGNHLKLAERYCKEQIAGNYKEEYNIIYLRLLREIYTVNKDDIGLSEVISRMFPYTFSFEDYHFIISRITNEDEQKNWRSKMLARARNAVRNYNYNAVEFCFTLANQEQKYTRMIEYIDTYAPYTLIAKYFEPMAAADKNLLLQALINKSDSLYSWQMNENKTANAAAIAELFANMVKVYSKNYLKSEIEKSGKLIRYHRSNVLFDYIKEALNSADE